MNITEFAQYAGVSKAAVEATGYRPSMQAQMLRTRRTRQVGVILPKLSSDSCPRMVEGIGSVLEESGYQLLLINTANDTKKELQALDTLRQHTVDGIILIAALYTPEHKALLEHLHVPIVILGQDFPGCCSVYHDDAGAAQSATAHMLAKGRRAPGYIGVTLLDKCAGQQRRAGFEAALKAAGLPLHPERMAVAKFSQESGYEQAAKLLARNPHIDCLFCATDAIALGAMQYCREHGIRIPEDVMDCLGGRQQGGAQCLCAADECPPALQDRRARCRRPSDGPAGRPARRAPQPDAGV